MGNKKILGKIVERNFFLLSLFIFIGGCSTSENSTPNADSELLDILKTNEWESSKCESHMGHLYTKHSFTVTDSELIFKYLDYQVDCTEQFGEFTEVRPFTLGEQLITSSGIEATEVDILTVVLQPGDLTHNIKDLVYFNSEILYFGVTGREIDCEPGNVRVDVSGGFGGYIPEAYVCDQRPTVIDFDNYYTKKI